MRLSGKRAFVTAAGAGIGRATALAFAKEGAQVIATDINADALKDLPSENLETQELDVTDKDAVQSIVKSVGTTQYSLQLCLDKFIMEQLWIAKKILLTFVIS